MNPESDKLKRQLKEALEREAGWCADFATLKFALEETKHALREARATSKDGPKPAAIEPIKDPPPPPPPPEPPPPPPRVPVPVPIYAALQLLPEPMLEDRANEYARESDAERRRLEQVLTDIKGSLQLAMLHLPNVAVHCTQLEQELRWLRSVVATAREDVSNARARLAEMVGRLRDAEGWGGAAYRACRYLDHVIPVEAGLDDERIRQVADEVVLLRERIKVLENHPDGSLSVLDGDDTGKSGDGHRAAG